MESLRVSNRYARSLFDLAVEKKCLDKIQQDIRVIHSALKSSQDLTRFIRNPEVPTKKRLEILKAVFRKDISGLTYEFLSFLERKGRIAFLGSICLTFEKLCDDYNRVMKVEFITAKEMTKESVLSVCARLKNKFQKEIIPQVTIDRSLIGGFKIQNEDIIFDFSVANQLEKFKANIIRSQ